MLSRQRFLKTMRFGTPDRVPYFEEGIRDNVLETWRTQGLGPDGDLSKLLLTDQRIEIDPDLYPHLEIERWPTSCKKLEVFQRHLDPSDPNRLPYKKKCSKLSQLLGDFIKNNATSYQ